MKKGLSSFQTAPQIGAFLASICDRILIMAAHRILIVDDQHEVRRMLSTSLRTLGPEIEVVDVPSGEEALLVASRRPVDLLISDVRLPGLSGLELMARVHKRNP